MLSSLSGAQPLPTRIQAHLNRLALTQDERFKLAEIVFKYDARHLTAADTRALRKELHSAGLWPSLAVARTLHKAGFNLNPLRLKMPFRRPLESPDAQRIAQALAPLQAVVSRYDLAHMTEADEISLYNRMRDAGLWH